MDAVLIILGILGFGAIVVAAYVFTVAARNYVSDEYLVPDTQPADSHRAGWVERSAVDRRRQSAAGFPLNINGVVIPHDRRHQQERRRQAA